MHYYTLYSIFIFITFLKKGGVRNYSLPHHTHITDSALHNHLNPAFSFLAHPQPCLSDKPFSFLLFIYFYWFLFYISTMKQLTTSLVKANLTRRNMRLSMMRKLLPLMLLTLKYSMFFILFPYRSHLFLVITNTTTLHPSQWHNDDADAEWIGGCNKEKRIIHLLGYSRVCFLFHFISLFITDTFFYSY